MRQIVHGILIVNGVQLVQLLEAFLILTVQNLTILTKWGVHDPTTFLDLVVAQIIWGWVVPLQNCWRVLWWLHFRICNWHLLEPTKGSIVIFHNCLTLIWYQIISVKHFIEHPVWNSGEMTSSWAAHCIHLLADCLRGLLKVFVVDIRGLWRVDS